jgi:hypothetical protein
MSRKETAFAPRKDNIRNRPKGKIKGLNFTTPLMTRRRMEHLEHG